MVIDTSAAIAILFNEPEAAAFTRAIEADLTRLMPATAVFESSLVVERAIGLAGASALDTLLHEMRVAIVPFGEADLAQARLAFRTFGKGRHAAALNFGDCMVYAACKASGEALLFKGGDFAETDVPAHPASVG
jgi:ribonuclease VapC